MIEELEQECWSLDMSLAEHILPRLLYFKNWAYHHGIPSEFMIEETWEALEDEWDEVISEMIWAFSYIVSGYTTEASNYIDFISIDPFMTVKLDGFDEARERDEARMKRCQHGLRLFARYYRELWV